MGLGYPSAGYFASENFEPNLHWEVRHMVGAGGYAHYFVGMMDHGRYTQVARWRAVGSTDSVEDPGTMHLEVDSSGFGHYWQGVP